MSDIEKRPQILLRTSLRDLNPRDGNVDVDVVINDARYRATFFTIENLRTLMSAYRSSGECNNGSYLWACNMIVVDKITEEVVDATVADLLRSGEFKSAFAGPYADSDVLGKNPD